jgi:hypothetical protein
MEKRRDTYNREQWAKAFEFCMEQLTGVYGREFGHPAMKAYMDACEGWSIEKMREAFGKAIQAEKFCPTVATLKAYGSGVHEEAEAIVPEYVQPKYTPGERADIERIKKDLARKFAAMPWAQDLPTGGFMNLGRPTR